MKLITKLINQNTFTKTRFLNLTGGLYKASLNFTVAC